MPRESRRIATPDLKAKIDALMLFLRVGNLRQLALVVNMGRQTLDDAIDLSGFTDDTEKRFVSRLNNLGVNPEFSFSTGWDEWREAGGDPEEPAKEFADRLKRENPDFDPSTLQKATRAPVEAAGLTSGMHPSRDLGHLLQAERVEVTQPKGARLAGVDLWLTQSAAGEAWPVSFDLVCKYEQFPGFRLGVKRGILSLKLGAGEVSRDTQLEHANLEMPEHGDVPAREVAISIHNGQATAPAWELWSSNGPIGAFRLPDEHELCRIADLSPGDVITLTFKVYAADLVMLDENLDDEDAENNETASFLRADGKPLTPAKRKLIKAMLIECGVPIDPSGWVSISVDARLMVKVAKDDDNG